jgi:hypothetical protein
MRDVNLMVSSFYFFLLNRDEKVSQVELPFFWKKGTSLASTSIDVCKHIYYEIIIKSIKKGDVGITLRVTNIALSCID